MDDTKTTQVTGEQRTRSGAASLFSAAHGYPSLRSESGDVPAGVEREGSGRSSDSPRKNHCVKHDEDYRGGRCIACEEERFEAPLPCAATPLPPVLDACCGSRMMWFDKKDSRALFVDIRHETHIQKSERWNDREIVVAPDVVADFQQLPFPDDSFQMVVFDPPHMSKMGEHSTTAKTYGKLFSDWRTTLAGGFAECFRVLKPGGTLIFKWCAFEIPLADVLALTDAKPLFGTKYGKREKSHWLAFLKDSRSDSPAGRAAGAGGVDENAPAKEATDNEPS